MNEYYVQVSLKSGDVRTIRTARLEIAMRCAAIARREGLLVIVGMEMGHVASRRV